MNGARENEVFTIIMSCHVMNYYCYDYVDDDDERDEGWMSYVIVAAGRAN